MTTLSIHKSLNQWVLIEAIPFCTRRVCAVNLSDVDSRPDPITRAWNAVKAKRGME